MRTTLTSHLAGRKAKDVANLRMAGRHNDNVGHSVDLRLYLGRGKPRFRHRAGQEGGDEGGRNGKMEER